MPPPCAVGCGVLLPFVRWLWVLGLAKALSFCGLGLVVQGLGLNGIRLRVDKGLGRVWGVCSLGLTVFVPH